jgi:hypothetical protein
LIKSYLLIGAFKEDVHVCPAANTAVKCCEDSNKRMGEIFTLLYDNGGLRGPTLSTPQEFLGTWYALRDCQISV